MPISLSQLATGSASCGAWAAYPPPGRTIMCVPGDSGYVVMAVLHLTRLAEEDLDVSGELRVMLEQEPVRRVRVDLHPGLRDQAGQKIGVVRQDHRVAVAVGHEHRHGYSAQSLEQRVIGDPPGAHRVVLRFARRPGCRRVPVLGPGVHALRGFLAGLPAGRGSGEEDVEVFP